MNNDTKRDLKLVGEVYPDLVQIQVEDYCPKSFIVVVTNSEEITKRDEDYI